MNRAELMTQVRELRADGNSPMQIAKALGVRPAVVVPLVHKLATEEEANTAPADRALLGCWINPGWGAGLGLEDASAEWYAPDSGADIGVGLAGVLVARREGPSRAAVSGFLVDVYCLGVKDAIGPVIMSARSVDDYRRTFFDAFQVRPVDAPIELAQHVVHGAVAYARDLGFEPHPDFAGTAPYLGLPSGPTPIRFGRDGSPLYISGPNDDQAAIARALLAGGQLPAPTKARWPSSVGRRRADSATEQPRLSERGPEQSRVGNSASSGLSRT